MSGIEYDGSVNVFVLTSRKMMKHLSHQVLVARQREPQKAHVPFEGGLLKRFDHRFSFK